MHHLETAVTRIALFIPQDCSLLSYALIDDIFSLANQYLGTQKYQLTLIGCVEHLIADHGKGAVVGGLSALESAELVILLAETPPESAVSIEIKKSLQRYYQQHSGKILSLKAGLWWLLESGIGLDQEWVVHWSLMDDFKDRYPTIALSQDLYLNDKRLHSCAGQLAIVDYLISYMADVEEQSLVHHLCDYLCLDRLRVGNERQRLPSHAFAGEDIQPRLSMAIELMENNIEEPLTTDEIAERVAISRRQLERLFKRYMNTMPARYYLQTRLKRAHHLLQNSNMSIVQIGLSCGFSSGPHFSSSYKSYYHSTPREERAKCFTNR